MSAREGVDAGKRNLLLEFLYDLDGSVLCTKWVGELVVLLFLPNIPCLQRFVFPPAVKASLASFPYHLRYANKSLLLWTWTQRKRSVQVAHSCDKKSGSFLFKWWKMLTVLDSPRRILSIVANVTRCTGGGPSFRLWLASLAVCARAVLCDLEANTHWAVKARAGFPILEMPWMTLILCRGWACFCKHGCRRAVAIAKQAG